MFIESPGFSLIFGGGEEVVFIVNALVHCEILRYNGKAIMYSGKNRGSDDYNEKNIINRR